MKMFQGFGKVDLPKLKWRSERHDGNARAMGGVLAVQWVAVKRQSLPLLASGLWLLLAGCCWPCRNGEKNCFQRSAMKSINLIRVGNMSLGVPIFLANISLLWAAGIVVSNWLICPFFVFVFWLSISFSGLTARNMSAN